MSANIWTPGGEVLVNSNNAIAVENFTISSPSQSLFTLTNFTYTPGSNSIAVYINGVLQRSGIDYSETSNASISFISHTFTAGDSVTIIGQTQLVSGAGNPFGTLLTKQIAFAGQTVFTISETAYVPNNGSLRVYQNGLLQEPGDSYIEGPDNITFSTGLEEGDEVIFSFNSEIGIGQQAAYVSYTGAGTGAVATDVQSKLREFVSVKDFGADSADDVTQINAAITHAMVAGVRVYFPFSATIRVPEDAPTLQAAFDALAPNVSPDVKITVRISAGHALTDGLVIEDGDFSNFQITSVDATVLLAPGFTPINGGDAFSATSVFLARDAKAPEWRFLLNVADAAAVTGLVYTRAYGFVAGSCGVTNAGGYNLYVNNQSDVFATNAIFTGAGYGNRVTVSSQLTAPQANFSGTKSQLYVGTNRAANLDVSRGSVVYVTGTPAAPTNLTGGLGRGLAVRRSYVSATNVDCSGAAAGGLVAANGAIVAFSGSIASGCTGSGITSNASFVAFEQGIAINNAFYNLYAEDGGRIVARNAVLTGGGTNGVLAVNGGEVTCPGANCRRNGVSDQSTDIAVSAGGYVSAVGALGGVNIVALSNDTNGTIIKESESIRLRTNSGSDRASTIDFDHAGLTAATADLRFWRGTATTGLKRLLFYRGDGTGTLDAQIGVGGTSSFFASGSTVFGGSTIPASAVLSAESTTKGFLPPRMTTVQRDAIVSPDAGLVIYNTTTGKLNVRGAAAWEAVTSA
jgi:hypothetical protein